VIAVERGAAEAPHWAVGEYAGIFEEHGDLVRRCLFVAELEGAVVGFAVGKVIGTTADSLAELESVVVEERVRRGGVGRALCAAVIVWSRDRGAAELELEVRAGGAGAIALYAGLGFVETGRRRAYYDSPVEDAVLMRMGLGEC
jgi:ribosomal-protein-alanine N-acetyltransferase